ncbi:hypothetical protein WA171_004988, partial [Blastocystis sp. BT1]
MEVILNKIEEQLEVIDKQLEGFEYLNKISKKMNIRVSLLSTISILFLSIFCYIVCGPSLLANIIGCAYPLYYSLSLLISHSFEEYIEIIVYWSVFGLLYTIESLFSNISYYLPFFYPFKVSLLLACISKETNLSKVIYEDVLMKTFGLPDLSEAKRSQLVETLQNS